MGNLYGKLLILSRIILVDMVGIEPDDHFDAMKQIEQHLIGSTALTDRRKR